MNGWKTVQHALEYAARGLDQNLTLNELATRTNQCPSHIHRTLRAALRETPKQFTLRLRVDRAATALISSRSSILDIALDCGFESHEAFCRAFRRRFQMSPSAYRKQGLKGTTRAHVHFVNEIGPCVGLYHIDQRGESSKESIRESMEYEISKEERPEQAILVILRKIRRSEIAATIGAELPKVFLHAQRRGISIEGYPITRYLETSVGLVTLETGMRVTGHDSEWTAAFGQGDVRAETLPAGPVAVTIHSGPYDQLPAAYAALEEWMAANGFHASAAPWEGYLNDPADHPDPRDWKTEVCWPVSIP